MDYISTRGKSTKVSYEDALFSGYAPDGGLYMPDLNKIPILQWREWRSKSYPEIVKELVKFFLDPELPLDNLISDVYKDRFSCDEVVNLHKLEKDLSVLELFHGTTWAFKDYALFPLGQILQHCLERKKRHQIVLVGTSGDTGSSAIEAVKNHKNSQIIVLFPYGRISEIQEKQMTTVQASNVHVFAGDGCSDDLDVTIRELMNDDELSTHYNLGSINSINWVRICMQMAHWFYAYFKQMRFKPDHQILTVAVPTGAAGNITAGILAWKLGLPIKIVACTNKNDSFHQFIQTGTLSKGPIDVSLAPAMDIQVPYNVERILYMVSNGNQELVRTLMTEYEKNGSVALPEDLHKQLREIVVDSHCVQDIEIREVIKVCYGMYNYYICPHTATALSYGLRKHQNITPLVCIATASPQKFLDVYEKCGITVPEKSEQYERIIKSEIKEPTRLMEEEKSQWMNIVKKKILEVGVRSRNRNN